MTLNDLTSDDFYSIHRALRRYKNFLGTLTHGEYSIKDSDALTNDMARIEDIIEMFSDLYLAGSINTPA